MKWPWRLGRKRLRAPYVPTPEDDAQGAAVQYHVEAARARQKRVDAVVQETERLRKQNNFGPTIAKALGARPK